MRTTTAGTLIKTRSERMSVGLATVGQAIEEFTRAARARRHSGIASVVECGCQNERRRSPRLVRRYVAVGGLIPGEHARQSGLPHAIRQREVGRFLRLRDQAERHADIRRQQLRSRVRGPTRNRPTLAAAARSSVSWASAGEVIAHGLPRSTLPYSSA